MTQDWITRASERTDATARPGSDSNIPDTTSPKIATTAIRLQLLANAGELYHVLSVIVGGHLRGSARQSCQPLLSKLPSHAPSVDAIRPLRLLTRQRVIWRL